MGGIRVIQPSLGYSPFMQLRHLQEMKLELSTGKTRPYKYGSICQASSSSQGNVTINRCNMHPLEFALLLPAAFGERERERKKGCSRDGSHQSALKTILDENPQRARRFFFFNICALHFPLTS